MRSLLLLVLLGACLPCLLAASLRRQGILTPFSDLPAAALAASALLSGSPCLDVKPPGSPEYTCEQQQSWGKCSESWMNGYCKKTCGTCNNDITPPPVPVPVPEPDVPDQPVEPIHPGTSSLPALGIKAGNLYSAPIQSYGSTYGANKARVLSALRSAGFSTAQQRLLLAIGNLETNSFDPNDRDKQKSGDSTNYSQFNINRDMLRRVGYSTGEMAQMNSWSGLSVTVGALKKLIARFGVNGFLNFLRGGSTGYGNGVSYGCKDYRTGIASIVHMIDNDPSYMTDDRRIDLTVQHV